MIVDKKERAEYVHDVFSRIAKRYDLMNRIMTGGMDLSWRKKLIRKAQIENGCLVLDLGAGTGDLSRQTYKTNPNIKIIAGDFTLQMMMVKKNWEGIQRCNMDALNLPIEDNSFDRVISGFLVRNVVDIDQVLAEQYRVLKPGGRMVILDMTRPRKNILSPLINFYINRVVPLIGSVITGQRDAYTYLPESTQNFLQAETLREKINNKGFTFLGFEILNFGTVAIHTAIKPY